MIHGTPLMTLLGLLKYEGVTTPTSLLCAAEEDYERLMASEEADANTICSLRAALQDREREIQQLERRLKEQDAPRMYAACITGDPDVLLRNKIQAIKEFRSLTGRGLADSKRVVETIIGGECKGIHVSLRLGHAPAEFFTITAE